MSNSQHSKYYIYSLEGSGSTGRSSYWVISNQVSDTTYLIAGFNANATCPDGKGCRTVFKNKGISM